MVHNNQMNPKEEEGSIEMPNRRMELKVCNPRGGLEVPAMESPSPRLQSLDGKKIGILKFSLWGLVETILPQLEDELRKRFDRIEYYRAPSLYGNQFGKDYAGRSGP